MNKKKTVQRVAALPVNSAFGVCLCCATLGVSGLLALRQTASEIDAGQTFTLAEARQYRIQEFERIKSDTRMPPQAKKMALAALGGAFVSKTGPPNQ